MENLLLVEDDQALAMGTEYSLKAEGYGVIVANQLSMARQVLFQEEKEISLVLLDVMLPDGTGFEFCREIREQGLMVPIIFLTAVAEEANIVQGLEIGADDYITKPFRVKELLSRVKAILRRQNQYARIGEKTGKITPQEKENQRIYFGGYVMDLDNYRLYLGSVPVDCTPSEFRLLRELLVHRGQVLTREQLIQRLWDVDGSFVDDNTLSVYIKRLRDKLPGIKDCIQTVRGVGYQYVEKKV